MNEEIISVKIQTKDGRILVSQSSYDQDTDDHLVMLSPVQIDLVCALLQEAKAEIVGAK